MHRREFTEEERKTQSQQRSLRSIAYQTARNFIFRPQPEVEQEEQLAQERAQIALPVEEDQEEQLQLDQKEGLAGDAFAFDALVPVEVMAL
jgi:hypothetical protein